MRLNAVTRFLSGFGLSNWRRTAAIDTYLTQSKSSGLLKYLNSQTLWLQNREFKYVDLSRRCYKLAT